MAERVGRDPTARRGGFRDDRRPVGADARDRVRKVPRMRNGPPVARVVAAETLARAFEEVADEDARGQPVPVVEAPAVLVHERREEQRCVGDAAGDDDVGALRERVDDRARTEVRGREERRAPEGLERFAGVEMREGLPALGVQLGEVGEHVVADDGRDGDAADAELPRGLDRGARGRGRVDPARVGDDLRATVRDERHRAGEVRREVARVTTRLVALTVLLEDGERQLRQRLQAQVVDALGEERVDRGGAVAVEALPAGDPYVRHGRPAAGRPTAAPARAGPRRAARGLPARTRS